ncbi:Glycoside hydrolase, family 9 [Corchorus olitorius]|uniref:cellulase n=1 Tax=Corchorus olitorius TaxID=93759 RepID=A0A1R3K5Y9_9ROSI|nr:Glycoside hydrolase, family 9 [Corchorus olitorius]
MIDTYIYPVYSSTLLINVSSTVSSAVYVCWVDGISHIDKWQLTFNMAILDPPYTHKDLTRLQILHSYTLYDSLGLEGKISCDSRAVHVRPMCNILKKKIVLSRANQREPFPGPPDTIDKKYADALKIAMQFFDVQKCTFLLTLIHSVLFSGKLENNKISWRGDSALKDGSEADLDLSKGMYDAGDHLKSGFSLAFTATVLSWAILEYGDQMDAVKPLESAQDSLKWITDFLINVNE